jgi:hypothetical protein
MPERRAGEQHGVGTAIERRAVMLWPRLDRKALRSCRHDPRRIAALVSRRTSLSVDTILGMLLEAGQPKAR